MTPENFVYWLQGFFELTESKNLSESQVQVIKNHLALVFDKKTPVTPIVTPIKPQPSDKFTPIPTPVPDVFPWIKRTPLEITPYPYVPPTIPYPYVPPTITC